MKIGNTGSWIVILGLFAVAGLSFLRGSRSETQLNNDDRISGLFLRKESGPLIALIDLKGKLQFGDKPGEMEAVDQFRIAKSYLLNNSAQFNGCIIRVNSEGGEVVAGKALNRMIGDISKVMPTYAYIETVGASAAYHAILACNKVFAEDFSMVGSIGVSIQRLDYSQIMKTFGVKFQSVASGRYKTMFQGGDVPTKEEEELSRKIVSDAANGFWNDVEKARKIHKYEMPDHLKEGAMCSGVDAKRFGLIDELGSLEFACNDLLNCIGFDDAKNFSLLLVSVRTQKDDGMSKLLMKVIGR